MDKEDKKTPHHPVKAGGTGQAFPQREQEILKFWEDNKIFEKSLEKTKKKKPFRFYEGPPYANGKPGIHHVLARCYKDIILRFKTMQGFYVERKSGWDTHGLPIELEIEKKLSLRSKKDIEKFGVERFVEEAKKVVFENIDDWEQMTKKMGYWLDLENPYVTMTNDYVESLWWVFSQIAKNGYLYQDYRVLPWCPRCGTSLSSHEVAQEYKKVREESIYVKFPLRTVKDIENVKNAQVEQFKQAERLNNLNIFFLVWTTTPWTLPGNVALAVNPKANYAVVEIDGEKLILAKDRIDILGDNYKIIEEKKGKDLIAMEYEALFVGRAMSDNGRAMSDNSNTDGTRLYQVVAGDFVNMEEGTGIVHIAPAFGADDMAVGKKNNLPTLITVDEDGKMNTPGHDWDKKYFKDADDLVKKDLEKRGLVFKKEMYEHDYPFCWRCKNALMYYAKNSWFLKTTAVAKEMLEENQKINWQPKFVGEGRFGEWLKGNVDWAISRERYWGMPLPIWQCQIGKSEIRNQKFETPNTRAKLGTGQANSKSQIQNSKQEGCGNYVVIGSLEELDKYALENKTEVYVMRHGEAGHNIKNTTGPVAARIDENTHLTERGKKQVKKEAEKLKKTGIDVIVSSPLTRAKETAEILKQELNIPVEINKKLYDINAGDEDGVDLDDLHKRYSFDDILIKGFPNGESWRDVRARMTRALKEILAKHKNKKIILVSHADSLWLLNSALEGFTEKEYKGQWYPKLAEVKKLNLHNWPYNASGELDIHKPYIDEIKIKCDKCSKQMSRVPETADIWFDSGAMPYAQWHYPFENKEKIDKGAHFPADYICEGIDQTRGWFYTLLATSSLLKKPAPYKNVATIGLVLDEKGEKMSKSKGNVVEPLPLFEKYGADAVRWYFYTINQPWDEKLFRESDVGDASRRFLNILWNSYKYWHTYKIRNPKSEIRNPEYQSKARYGAGKFKIQNSKLIINKWVLVRLNQLGYEVTQLIEDYDVVSAARKIEHFVVEDISHWYIRRIRDIMKAGNEQDKKEVSLVLGQVLLELSKMLAPFTPFVAESIYKGLGFGGEGVESVHIEDWQKFKKLSKADEKLVEEMNEARKIVSLALDARTKASIKVRQPLAELKVKEKKFDKDIAELIKGEVNIKKITYDKNIKNATELNTELTTELKEEGMLRELTRQIQDLRKSAGLNPQDKITLGIETDDKGEELIKKYEKELMAEVNAKEVKYEKLPKLLNQAELKLEELVFDIALDKI